MRVGEICTREMYVAHPSETVARAARRMRLENVGALVVLDNQKRLVGLLTDRDLIVRVIARGRVASKVRVRSVMTKDPPVVSEETDVVAALELMKEVDLRRLPVVDAHGELRGLLTVEDLLDVYASHHIDVGHMVGGHHVRH